MKNLLFAAAFTTLAAGGLSAAERSPETLKAGPESVDLSLDASGLEERVTDSARSQNLAALKAGSKDLTGDRAVADISPLISRSRELTDLLKTNGSRLTASQYADLSRQLAGAIDTVKNAGSGNASGCFSAAYQSLNQTEAVELCSGGGVIETVQCYKEAYRSLNSVEAIKLCKHGGSLEAAQCYKEAYRSLNTVQSIQLCSERGTLATPACYKEAYRSLNTEQSIRLCLKGGTPERVNCFGNAYRSLSLEEAIKICSPQ